MAIELLPPQEAHPDNPRWHELRRQGVTASEIAVILGLSTWDSPWALWHRKQGLLDDTPAGESAYWGRHLEDAIAAAAVDRVDPHGQLGFEHAGLYCHPQRRWQWPPGPPGHPRRAARQAARDQAPAVAGRVG